MRKGFVTREEDLGYSGAHDFYWVKGLVSLKLQLVCSGTTCPDYGKQAG